MQKSQFPRILVVDGSQLSLSVNMGILKSHLLLKWPSTEIAHVVTSGLIDSNSKAKRQFILTKRGILFRQSGIELDSNAATVIKKSIPTNQTTKKNSIIREILNLLSLKLNLHFYKFYKPITHYFRSSPLVLSSRLFSFVEKFKPEIILTFGGTLPELKMAYLLSDKYKTPLVMYITDDYIGWTYKDVYLSKYFTSQLEKYFHLCLTSSIARFTVGKKMEQEYTKRYNLVFTTVMDGIDTNLYKDRPTKILKDEISFYYLGSLEPNRWFNLKQIGLALTELNITQNKKLKLIIHSFKNDKIKYAEKFEDINCIEFKDPLPFEDVPKCQMNADILIHVESFEESTASVMTKYSISTKIFQYLASGTPILAFGPRDIASIDFLRDFVTATIVDEMSMEVLKDRLSYIINNLSKINSDSEKTRNYALTNLSLDAISNQFAVEIISRSNNSTQQ